MTVNRFNRLRRRPRASAVQDLAELRTAVQDLAGLRTARPNLAPAFGLRQSSAALGPAGLAVPKHPGSFAGKRQRTGAVQDLAELRTARVNLAPAFGLRQSSAALGPGRPSVPRHPGGTPESARGRAQSKTWRKIPAGLSRFINGVPMGSPISAGVTPQKSPPPLRLTCVRAIAMLPSCRANPDSSVPVRSIT
jgi:hypothetical protein